VGTVADLVEVSGAQAPLQVDQASAQRVGLALQIRSQWVHPRGGEQHRVSGWGHQRVARDDLVAALAEESDESLYGLLPVHDMALPGWGTGKTAGAAMNVTGDAPANRFRSPGDSGEGQAAAAGEPIARTAAAMLGGMTLMSLTIRTAADAS
jgi:hypothetical protein